MAGIFPTNLGAKLNPLRLAKAAVNRTHYLPLIIKTESVRKNHYVPILQRVHQELNAAGVKHRFGPMFLIDPSTELVNALYYEHSGTDLAKYGITGAEGNLNNKTWPLLGRFMQGEVIASPLIVVMVEAQTSSLQELITIIRGFLGETRPILRIRNEPDKANAERGKIRYQHSTMARARLSPFPDSDGGEVSLYTAVHCPAHPLEAVTQLKILFRPEDLASHYDEAAAAEIVGTGANIPRGSVSLAELAEGDPTEIATRLKGSFRTLASTSDHDVATLIRGLRSLIPLVQATERELADSLQAPYDYVPYPPQVSTDAPAHVFAVVGPRGSGKSTTANTLLKRGSLDALISPYVHLGTSQGAEETELEETEAMELLGQNAFVSAELGPGGWYLFTRSSLDGFVNYQGGRALVFCGPGHIRDLQAWAQSQGNVVVHTARLDVTEENLRARLSNRGRNGDAQAMRHIAAICKGLAADAHLYEYTLDGNGAPDEVANSYEAWFRQAEAGRLPAIAMPEQGNPSPHKLLIKQLFRKIIVQELMTRIMPNERLTGNTNKLVKFFEKNILPWIGALYEEIYRSTYGTIPEDSAAMAKLSETIYHAFWYLISAVQASISFSDPEVFKQDPEAVYAVALRFLGRLGIKSTDLEKIRSNYIKMAETLRSLPLPEAFLWAIYHDIVKVEAFNFHHTRTVEWLDNFDVLADFQANFPEFSDKKMALIRATLKHHHVIGSCNTRASLLVM